MIKQGRGYISKVRENQGSTEPFNTIIQCKGRQALNLSELPGGGKTARNFLKNLKAGYRRTGRKLGKGEVKQKQMQELCKTQEV